MTKHFAAIPAGIQSRISELSKHEYWGESFARGDCQFLVAVKENGRAMLICSHGTWDHYTASAKDRDYVSLQHTQSFAVTYTATKLKDADVVTKDNLAEMIAKYGDKKLPTWTLK